MLYNKLLVASDLDEDTENILIKARKLVDEAGDKIHLVHVLEPIPTVYAVNAYMDGENELQLRAMEASNQSLLKLAKKAQIPAVNTHLVLGSPASEIRQLAAKIQADLIVVGSHGKSGWRLLLGSTANSVLHGADCDVLTVRIGEIQE